MGTSGLAVMKRILVPVDGSPASMEAVAVACILARRNKGKVYAVYVVEVHRSLPLDAELLPETQKGEEILDQAEQTADSLDYQVEGALLQAREAAAAVVDEAVERGIDTIILGIDYKRPLGEFQMGRTASYILKNAPCEVLICRRPAT